MHPILAIRLRLGLYILSWFPVGCLLAALLWLASPRPIGATLLFTLPLAALLGFLSLAAWSVCRSAPLGRTGAGRLVATHLAAAAATSTLWTLMAGGWAGLLGQVRATTSMRERYIDDAALLFVSGAVLFLMSSVVHYLVIAFEASREAERRALELQVRSREAELRALRAQINPHFLFNSLNSISALAGSDAAAARSACLLLADFLRASLRVGARESIPLAAELGLARAYLAVEKLRFAERLGVEVLVQPEAGGCLMPPLLLQPLVENAVGHGIAACVEGGTLRIEARRRGDRLEIVVENPYDADRPPGRGEGLGLANVRARLRALEPTDAWLEVRAEAGRYRATLRLPARDGTGGAGAGVAAAAAGLPGGMKDAG